MAATIAKAFGEDNSGRMKDASRLGHRSATAQANTWNTFTECHVEKDGSGYVKVVRNDREIHRFEFDAE